MKLSYGSYRHGKRVGLLKGNIYGERSTGNYFLKGLILQIKSQGHSPTDFDHCIFYKRFGADLILFAVCIDYF